MINRRLLLIVGGVVLIVAGIVTVVVATSSKSPQPLTEMPASQASPSTDPSAGSGEENPGQTEAENPTMTGHDDEHEGEQYPQAELDQMQGNAESGTKAYLTQVINETKTERKNRIDRYFTTNNPLLTAKVPRADVSTVSARILESEFTAASKPTNVALLVFADVNVNTGFDAYRENQTWLVELTREQGVWVIVTIKESDLPYVEPQS